MGFLRTAAVVVPVGPGKESVLDTLESIEHFCKETHTVVIVDDYTTDGTYEAIIAVKRDNWIVLRNPQPCGIKKLVHSLCTAFNYVLSNTNCECILRIDMDALLTKPGVLSDAFQFMERDERVGIFGVYEVDYDRPRSYQAHADLMTLEMRWYRRVLGLTPYWSEYLRTAEAKGYKRGDNVFGGAYFLTRACVIGMKALGALDPPARWTSRIQEDVYFSMAAVASGFRMAHFAAPSGPLCMEWRGLPAPARTLLQSHYKLVHSVDKGKNTGPGENGGLTAREVFRRARRGDMREDFGRDAVGLR